MAPPLLARLAPLGLVLALTPSPLARAQPQAQAPEPAKAAPAAETPGLRATQVTLVINKDGKGRTFRATVLARKDDLLTVLTAAHCLSADDVDGPATVVVDREVIEGTVASVVRNPAYRPLSSRGTVPGADNAIARVRVKLAARGEAEAFDSLRPALGVAAHPYPAPSGQTVVVRMIDRHGVEHAVKAGNYSNPRLLEWGLSYKPIPGDSGAGVFALGGGADRQAAPRPILIGIIAGNDDHGGMASIISKEMRWIADELAR